MVTYKGKSEPCKRAGIYADPDGKRFWCGLHNPQARERREEKKAQRQEKVKAEAQQAASEAVQKEVKAELIDRAIEALQEARSSFIEICNMRDVGWPEGTPTDKYQALLSHINTVAGDAGEKMSVLIREIHADIKRAARPS
jgi:hypothetical protein